MDFLFVKELDSFSDNLSLRQFVCLFTPLWNNKFQTYCYNRVRDRCISCRQRLKFSWSYCHQVSSPPTAEYFWGRLHRCSGCDDGESRRRAAACDLRFTESLFRVTWVLKIFHRYWFVNVSIIAVLVNCNTCCMWLALYWVTIQGYVDKIRRGC